MKFRIISILLVGALFIQCTPKRDIISENIRNAEIQLGMLLEACEEGDTIRIPASYQNDQIKFVPKDDWVSGFFAGSLWYMYELTGEEYYAEQARKHTEILHDIQFRITHTTISFAKTF